MLGRIPAARQAIIDRIAASARRARRRGLPIAPDRLRALLLPRRLRARPRAARARGPRGRRARRSSSSAACAPQRPLAGARVQPGPGARRLRVLAHGHHGRHGRHAVPGRLARHGLHAERPRGAPARASGVLGRARPARTAEGRLPREPAGRRQARVLAAHRDRPRTGPAAPRRDRGEHPSATLGDVRAATARLAPHARQGARRGGRARRCDGCAARRARCARRRRCSSGWKTTTSRSSATANTACGAARGRTGWCRSHGSGLGVMRAAAGRKPKTIVLAGEVRAFARSAGAAHHHEGEFGLDGAPGDLSRLRRRQDVRREGQCHGRAALHRPVDLLRVQPQPRRDPGPAPQGAARHRPLPA